MTRITEDPNVMFGKPVIAGTRIPVDVIQRLLKDGFTPDEIVNDYYPDLTLGDIGATVERVK